MNRNNPHFGRRNRVVPEEEHTERNKRLKEISDQKKKADAEAEKAKFTDANYPSLGGGVVAKVAPTLTDYSKVARTNTPEEGVIPKNVSVEKLTTLLNHSNYVRKRESLTQADWDKLERELEEPDTSYRFVKPKEDAEGWTTTERKKPHQRKGAYGSDDLPPDDAEDVEVNGEIFDKLNKV
jgi:hypothetical protein